MSKQTLANMYLPPETKYSNAKYILPYIICFCFLLCAGRIIEQFITVNQLNKTSGKITNIETKFTPYTHHRFGGNTSDSVLVITINHGDEYDVEDTKARTYLGGLLHIDDQVTIYYPTKLYRILCAGFAHSVNQVELGKQVVYSFDEQKKFDYILIAFFGIAACVFWGMRYYNMKTYGP